VRLDALGAGLVEVALIVPQLCLFLAERLNYADGIDGLLRIAGTLPIGLQVLLKALLHDLEEAAHHQKKNWEDEQEEDGEPPAPQEGKEEP
jgi:hypothetical protein